jgi:hypothetical protein
MAIQQVGVGNNPQMPSATQYVYTPDQLIGGSFPIVSDSGMLASGKLARGAILGTVSATGNMVLSVRTAVDGSQVPSAILADDADATAGPVGIGVYLTGEFVATATVADASWTPAQIKAACRSANIFLKTSIGPNDPS